MFRYDWLMQWIVDLKFSLNLEKTLEQSLIKASYVHLERQWGGGRNEIHQMELLPLQCGINDHCYLLGTRPYLA